MIVTLVSHMRQLLETDDGHPSLLFIRLIVSLDGLRKIHARREVGENQMSQLISKYILSFLPKKRNTDPRINLQPFHTGTFTSWQKIYTRTSTTSQSAPWKI